LLIFDYDGTVVFSFKAFKESLRELLKRLHLEQSFTERELEFMAKTTPQIWLPRILSKISSQKKPKSESVLETFREIYSRKHLKLIKAVPNVHIVLKEIKKKNYVLALTTGRVLISDFVPIELKYLGLDSLFDLIHVPNRVRLFTCFYMKCHRFILGEPALRSGFHPSSSGCPTTHGVGLWFPYVSSGNHPFLGWCTPSSGTPLFNSSPYTNL